MTEAGRIAVLTEASFEDLELFVPKIRFEELGFKVDVLTPDGRARTGEYGYLVEADGAVGDARPKAYDALLLPGGVKNPDKLRMSGAAVGFVRDFWDLERPVFAICHGPWTLVEAGVLDGVRMTSYRSLRRDCENAGATWNDEACVVDGRLVTSRHPGDLPAFNRACVELLRPEAERRGRLPSGKRRSAPRPEDAGPGPALPEIEAGGL